MGKKRIFKTRKFSQWLKKSNLKDEDLVRATLEIEVGLYDAELGGNLYKKRVSSGNRGKSSGSRLILATKLGKYWFFLFGFDKNERQNINNVELAYLQKISEMLLDLKPIEIEKMKESKSLMEIYYDNE